MAGEISRAWTSRVDFAMEWALLGDPLEVATSGIEKKTEKI
jgi:hypothetical protein